MLTRLTPKSDHYMSMVYHTNHIWCWHDNTPSGHHKVWAGWGSCSPWYSGLIILTLVGQNLFYETWTYICIFYHLLPLGTNIGNGLKGPTDSMTILRWMGIPNWGKGLQWSKKCQRGSTHWTAGFGTICHNEGMGSWNPFLWKTKSCLFSVVSWSILTLFSWKKIVVLYIQSQSIFEGKVYFNFLGYFIIHIILIFMEVDI